MFERISRIRERSSREALYAEQTLAGAELAYAAEEIDTLRPHSSRIASRTYRFGRGSVVASRPRRKLGVRIGTDVQLSDGQWFRAFEVEIKSAMERHPVGEFADEGMGYDVMQLDIAEVKLPLVAELTARVQKMQDELAEQQAREDWSGISYTSSNIEQHMRWLRTLEYLDDTVRQLADQLRENFNYEQTDTYKYAIDAALLSRLNPHSELLDPWQRLAVKVLERNHRNGSQYHYDTTYSVNLAREITRPQLQSAYLVEQVEKAKLALASN